MCGGGQGTGTALQAIPPRVSLKPFPGYMPCGPQGLRSDKPSSNNPLTWPDLLRWHSLFLEPSFSGESSVLSHMLTFRPQTRPWLERTFSHTPLPHPCEPLRQPLVASSPLLPSDLGVRNSLGCFWASTFLASSHPVTLRVGSCCFLESSPCRWLSEWIFTFSSFHGDTSLHISSPQTSPPRLKSPLPVTLPHTCRSPSKGPFPEASPSPSVSFIWNTCDLFSVTHCPFLRTPHGS